MADEIVILVTAPSAEEAERIARQLVERRLVACVNIVAGVRSVFRWQGNVCDEKEVLMVLKSRKDKFEEISTEIKSLHSYDVPEIIALPIIAGSEEYLSWVRTETTPAN